jgi:hypothetical protein
MLYVAACCNCKGGQTAVETRTAASVFACVCIAASSYGRGTLGITFDGPPVQPPGTAYTVTNYYESGMSFTPIGSGGFGRIGADPRPERPDDGSAYLQAALGDSLMFSFANGSVFDLASVDLAEYSTVVPDAVTVPFVGYRSDGSTVTTSFTTDGIIDGTGPLADFQTFHFGPEFSGLTRVEIPTAGWSLDNLSVSVPEPTSGALLVVGALMLGATRLRNRRKGIPAK